MMNQLHKKRFLTRKRSNLLGWIIYLCAINVVALSRMYFACHFFHQCLLGAVLGHFIARYAIRNTSGMDKVYGFGKGQMLGIGVIVAMITAGVFFGQKLIGYDPLWSIKVVSRKHHENWMRGMCNLKLNTVFHSRHSTDVKTHSI